MYRVLIYSINLAVQLTCWVTEVPSEYRACSAGCKPTLLQLFGLLQLQSIERKIL
jgi:hypothetical protein